MHSTADDNTLEQLDHVLTVHFRGRYAAADVAQLLPEHGNSTDNFRATVHLHHHLAHLHARYAATCSNVDTSSKLRM